MKRELSIAAQCAKAIRKELKEKFPEIKFRVTSDIYSGGDSVDIDYTNGVIPEDINAIVKKYQYGKFDSMTDSYDMNNVARTIPQVKYVLVNRTISQEIKEKIKVEIAEDYGIEDITDEQEWWDKTGTWSTTRIYRETAKRTL